MSVQIELDVKTLNKIAIELLPCSLYVGLVDWVNGYHVSESYVSVILHMRVKKYFLVLGLVSFLFVVISWLIPSDCMYCRLWQH